MKDFCAPDNQGTILHELAVHPNATTNIVSQLIQAGCDPSNYEYISRLDLIFLDKPDRKGRTSVMWAIQKQSNVEVLPLLLERCDFSLGDENGKTVLHYAATVGDTEVVEMLLEKFKEKNLNLLDIKDGNSHKNTEVV